jgi:hypothetical protein
VLPFSFEKSSFPKFHVLEPFSKSLWYDSQNQVQSNSIDVAKSLEGLNTVNHIKRISLDGPDRSPIAWNTQNIGFCSCATCPSELHLTKRVTPDRELQNFHPKSPILIPLTPNSTLKLIHLITNIKRHSKQQETSN